MMMTSKATAIWQEYEKGVEQHRQQGLFAKTERCHNFYSGNQWQGLESGGKELPVLNFIRPVIRHKVSMIVQNSMQVVFSDMQNSNAHICTSLNNLASSTWEKSKMDTLSWRTVKNAAIAGMHYAYWFDTRDQYEDSIAINLRPQLDCRLIHTTNVFLADEQLMDLQGQEYIIISERITVKHARMVAKKSGIPPHMIEQIVSDARQECQLGETVSSEVKNKLGKCTSLLKFSRNDKGEVQFCRSVQSVVYQPNQPISGLKHYPIAAMRWEEQVGSSRGLSGVIQMIPTQVLVNKIAAWRGECVQRFAFPKLVVDRDGIYNPQALKNVGAVVEVDNKAGMPLNSIIDYLSPQPVSSDAERLQNEFIQLTRELEGAGDAATGAVDPTKASGEAIRAARDQAAVPLNEQIASYKQYIEDTAVIWYRLWAATSPNGLEFDTDNGPLLVSKKQLDTLNIDVKIDVTPVDPYSKVAQDLQLRGLMESGKITFEEYVEAIGEGSSMPRAILKSILDNRVKQQKLPVPQGGEKNAKML